MINVLIVDDHPLVAEGLRRLFDNAGSEYSCLVTYTAKDCLLALDVFIPQIVLLDINLPDGDGIDLCKTILDRYKSAKILALSSYKERSFITRMLANGAMGYVLKNSSEEEILAAVNDITSGKVHLGFEVEEIMNEKSKPGNIPLLTRRETEVLKLISEGFTNLEIAEKMFISPLTVDSHRKNMLLKLNARNTAMLIKIAINGGLI
jgi:DNA-binding NarL/FixJ family response regulator